MEVWSAYCATFGSAPSNPTQLLNFSKRDKDLPNLSFVQARALFKAQEDAIDEAEPTTEQKTPYFYSSTSKSPQQPSPSNSSPRKQPKPKSSWPPRRPSEETKSQPEPTPQDSPTPIPDPIIPQSQPKTVPDPQPEPEPEPIPTRQPTPPQQQRPPPQPASEPPTPIPPAATIVEEQKEPIRQVPTTDRKFGRGERSAPQWQTQTKKPVKQALADLRAREDDEDDSPGAPALVNSQSDNPKRPTPRRKSGSRRPSSRPGSRRGSRQLESSPIDPHANRRYRLKDGRIGVVKFMGRTQFGKASETWIGMVIEHGDGKHNGTVQGRRYFRCRDGKGVMVRPAALMDDLGSERLPLTQEMLNEVPIQAPVQKQKKRKSKSRSNSPRAEGHTRQQSYHIPRWDDYSENHGNWLNEKLHNPITLLNKHQGESVDKKKTVEEIGVTTHWIGPDYVVPDHGNPDFVEDWIAQHDNASEQAE